MLLPPSEGKTPPRDRGHRLDLDVLSAPGLNPVREKVLDALIEVSATPEAMQALGVGASLEADVARNVHLRSLPTGPAKHVYTGVLYAAAGLDRLTPTGRARAADTVRIVSGLWGLVAPDDRIPAYRLSMATHLPGLGHLPGVWRGPLGVELAARSEGELVVDCRSATYLAAWHPPRSADWVQVRVLRELDGKRSVVSHNAKHTRGVLTRHLLTRRGRAPQDAEALARVAGELVGSALLAVELGPPARGARTLELVVA